MICQRLKACVDGELSDKPISICDNNNRTHCIESSDRRASIKCEEKGKKYILVNTAKNHVISYKMDGGIITVDKTVPEGTGKCDYLYVVNADAPFAILTELKGVNVRKSLKQLYSTLILYKEFFKQFSHVYGRAIVTSSTPDLKASPEYVNLVRLIRQTYHGNIKIVKQQLKENDIQLASE